MQETLVAVVKYVDGSKTVSFIHRFVQERLLKLAFDPLHLCKDKFVIQALMQEIFVAVFKYVDSSNSVLFIYNFVQEKLLKLAFDPLIVEAEHLCMDKLVIQALMEETLVTVVKYVDGSKTVSFIHRFVQERLLKLALEPLIVLERVVSEAKHCCTDKLVMQALMQETLVAVVKYVDGSNASSFIHRFVQERLLKLAFEPLIVLEKTESEQVHACTDKLFV